MPEGNHLYEKTPVIHSMSMSKQAKCDVFLKLDNLQPPGSFKIRGISNMCQKAITERQCSHIYCASGGNAGLATAYVCHKLNMPCTVVLPESTPSFTADKLRELGADVHIHGKVWDHANQYALEQSKKPGCEYVPPFDHPDIWEGHESIITESASQLAQKPDVIITCVGGGGLLNGILQGLSKVGWENVPVVAMETEGADCFNQSVKAGKIITLPDITSLAKCLGSCVVSSKTWDYYNSGKYKIISELVPDKDAVDACLKFLVYSNVIQQLQAKGQLPVTLKSALVIVCGGAVVTFDLLQKWKQELSL